MKLSNQAVVGNNLLSYRKNIYSQNGEDGIIERLFELLKIDRGYVCEFGAWDAKYLSNTYNIYKNNSNFTPILIESEKEYFDNIENNLKDVLKKFCFNKFVDSKENSENCLDNILDLVLEEDLKENFQLLSIDVDGPDYEIWKSFKKYRPKIVIIEVNSSYPVDQKVYPCVPSGASAAIMVDLAKDKGYELVCHTGNLFFITKELFPLLNINNNDLKNLFLEDWLTK